MSRDGDSPDDDIATPDPVTDATVTDATVACGDEEETAFWHLRLYVAGQSPKSLRALSNLKALCKQQMGHRFEIEVVDLVENPRLAADDEIVAIPTLVRRRPAPMRKIIGDLSDADRVRDGLQLSTKGEGPR